MVDFSEVPSVNKSPAAFAEFDPIGVPGQDVHTILVVGVKLAAGTMPTLTPTLVSGDTEGDGLAGVGSQLARMLRACRRVNRQARCLAIALAEPSGDKATGTITITGPSTGAGDLALYIGGDRVLVPVASGASATTIAAAIASAIGARPQLPVTASSALGVVTVTAKWNGADGNQITLGSRLGEEDPALPAGVGVSFSGATLAGGTGNPDLDTVVAVLEERRYDSIVCGITDATETMKLVTEVARRWTATVALDGHVFGARRGNLSALTTLGNARNSPELTLMGAGLSPTPPWIWAAQTAAADALFSHPGVPRYGVVLPDCMPPAVADRFDHSERNLLLVDGISTHRVDSGGRVIVDRLVTTYQTNGAGGEDDAWEALTTRRKASYLRRNWIAYIQATYPNYMLAADGTQADPGVPIVTPSVLKGEALAWFQRMERAGHVEDFDAFRRTLVSVRNADDLTRVDQLMEPVLTRELVTIATKVAFR